MGALEFEVGSVRGSSQRKVNTSVGESRKERRDPWEWLCRGEVRALECRLLGHEFRTCYRKLSPGVEDLASLEEMLVCGVVNGQARPRKP